MLNEIRDPQQIPGEPRRRWFTSPEFDLVVWYASDGTELGFQLCYGKGQDEHALTWFRDGGFTHRRVDDGESVLARRKCTPILVPDGRVDAAAVRTTFAAACGRIDPAVARFVSAVLAQFPGKDRNRNVT